MAFAIFLPTFEIKHKDNKKVGQNHFWIFKVFFLYADIFLSHLILFPDLFY